MNIPFHIKIRKKLNAFLNRLLFKFSNNSNTKNYINKDEIKNIMIIRPNYRIGNLIFLTPLLNELNNHLPSAKIDVIVGIRLAGQVLEKLPNIEKVIDIPRKLLYHPFMLFRLIKEVRKKRYDLTINIADGSMSSQIVLTFIKSRYKAGFINNKNWALLTHAIERENIYTHAGSQPIEFLKLFDIKLPEANIELDIKLTKEEIAIGEEDLESLLKKENFTNKPKVIVLFRNARFDKKIADEWWLKWYEALNKYDNNLIVVDILSPDILVKLDKNFLEYSHKNLRVLAAFFRACDMYISADTGPLHLSTAAQAKSLALFNKTSIETYGTLGKRNTTININDLSAQDVAHLTYEKLVKVIDTSY